MLLKMTTATVLQVPWCDQTYRVHTSSKARRSQSDKRLASAAVDTEEGGVVEFSLPSKVEFNVGFARGGKELTDN
jgi:hypothetical protein